MLLLLVSLLLVSVLLVSVLLVSVLLVLLLIHLPQQTHIPVTLLPSNIDSLGSRLWTLASHRHRATLTPTTHLLAVSKTRH
jgi:hypothetical protein